MKLATLGYQGLNPEIFFSILERNGVQTIVDIRELPISRKPGFSKTALMTQAELQHLRYIHMPDLGTPRDIRHDYREDHDWDRFSARYLAYLETQTAELDKLAELAKSESCCLLCFEADPLHCHRLYVANALLSKTNGKLKIDHLAAS